MILLRLSVVETVKCEHVGMTIPESGSRSFFGRSGFLAADFNCRFTPCGLAMPISCFELN